MIQVGHSALSAPVGFASVNEDGQVLLPIGMQVVGGLWQEADLSCWFRVMHEKQFNQTRMHYSTNEC